METAQKYMISFEPNWKSTSVVKSGKNPPERQIIIIPTISTNYVARNIKENLTHLEKVFAK